MSRVVGFPFTGAHLRNTTSVQGDTTDKLYIEMAQTQHTPGRFPDPGKCLGKDLVQSLALFQPCLELSRFTTQFRITESAHRLFQSVDLLYYFTHPLEFAVVLAAEDFPAYFS